jgi:hypothetical protein
MQDHRGHRRGRWPKATNRDTATGVHRRGHGEPRRSRPTDAPAAGRRVVRRSERPRPRTTRRRCWGCCVESGTTCGWRWRGAGRTPDSGLGLQLAAALGWFWYFTSAHEGVAELEATLTATPAAPARYAPGPCRRWPSSLAPGLASCTQTRGAPRPPTPVCSCSAPPATRPRRPTRPHCLPSRGLPPPTPPDR